MSDNFEGGCACGDIRFRLEAEPIVVHACHCRFCQRMSGSAFGLNAMIEADRLTLLGDAEPAAIATPSTHPQGQIVHRCPACGVGLWSEHPELGPKIPIVFAGALDWPERLAPDVHCWTASKHPWVVLPGDVPAFTGDYDPALVWSDRARARISAAAG